MVRKDQPNAQDWGDSVESLDMINLLALVWVAGCPTQETVVRFAAFSSNLIFNLSRGMLSDRYFYSRRCYRDPSFRSSVERV